MGTYTYQQAIDYTVRMVKGIPVSTIDEIIADQAAAIFWKSYPWSWTLATLTSISLVDGTQDYALGGSDASSVWRLVHTRITRSDVSPSQYRDLRIFRHQEPLLEQKIGWPNFQLISYESEVDKLRLEAAVSKPSGVTLALGGQYQQFPPKVTSLATTVPFPDYHLHVFADGLLWMLYRLADDKRQGSIVYRDGQAVMTGQMGIFYDAMNRIVESEEHGAADTIYPEESIGGGTSYPPALFGSW